MSEMRIVYTPRADATAESERTALGHTYGYILQAHRNKQAAGGMETGDKDAERRSGELNAKSRI